MATKKKVTPHKHVFPGGDIQCACGEYPICSCNRMKHLSYCECYEKPRKKKVTKKKTVKKTPKYKVKVTITPGEKLFKQRMKEKPELAELMSFWL